MDPMDSTPEFTDEHRSVLDFEKHWWKHQGNKAAQIQARLGISSTRYYRVLNAAISHPDALEHDPMLVKRLRRLRDVRKAHRRSRRIESYETGISPSSDQSS